MRTKKGIVTSAKMTGTVTVTVHRPVVHPVYQKRYTVSKKFLADSSGFDLGIGDRVLIAECRPLSKRKHFRVASILKQAPRVSEIGEEEGLSGVVQRKDRTRKGTEVIEGTEGTDVSTSVTSVTSATSVPSPS